MKTLVISDLHLGLRSKRDVLRREPVREVLLAALRDVDRLVLLGDTVEMLEGRPRAAMDIAMPVLRDIGRTLGRDREVVVVAGNHDHLLTRPWLRAQRQQGRSLGLASRVPVSSGPVLERFCAALAPARVQVRYPGVWLADRIWATHGHYLDRHLVRERQGRVGRAVVRAVPEKGATAWHYESASTISLTGMSGFLATNLPSVIGEPLDCATGIARSVSAAALPLSNKLVQHTVAPMSAALLGSQFRRVGLPAMGLVAERLQVRADHVIFGHLHRSGPRWDDPRAEWSPDGRRQLVNSGCWVYEPLLLTGADAPHPYWPGGAVVVEDDRAPVAVGLLDGIDDELLR